MQDLLCFSRFWITFYSIFDPLGTPQRAWNPFLEALHTIRAPWDPQAYSQCVILRCVFDVLFWKPSFYDGARHIWKPRSLQEALRERNKNHTRWYQALIFCIFCFFCKYACRAGGRLILEVSLLSWSLWRIFSAPLYLFCSGIYDSF